MKGTCINDGILPGNNIAPEVKVGDEYVINKIHVCSCGERHCDVGLELKINYVECYKCREKLPDGTHWAHSSRFRIIV